LINIVRREEQAKELRAKGAIVIVSDGTNVDEVKAEVLKITGGQGAAVGAHFLQYHNLRFRYL